MKLQPTILEFTHKLSAVLQLDVEVVDENLVRIAGTGPYNQFIGKKLNTSSRIFRYIIETKNSKVVIKTRTDPICKGCTTRDSCEETAFLGVPIMLNESCIGVISLVAFNQKSRETIKSNAKIFLDYIQHISQLFVIKVSESKKSSSGLDDVFSSLINNMDQGVLVLDDCNQVLHGNAPAIANLNITQAELTNIKINIRPLLVHNNKLKGAEQHIITLGKRQEIVIGQFHIINNQQLFLMSFYQPHNSIAQDDTFDSQFNNIIGESPQILQLKALVSRVAKSPSSILIYGESGTGKEVFAKAIHANSNRSRQNFIAINCAAIPEQLLESELFGYVKGAFTGALNKGKIGLIQAANNGTLFLDEIGDMSMTLQSKLLRVLEEREVMPIGSNSPVKVNIRIISATNRNFTEMIGQNDFREDLFYRLNVIPMHLPALREREGDIERLIYHFLEHHSHAIGAYYPGITDKVLSSLNAYHWPGNIRELSNLIEYLVNIVPIGDQIDVDLLPPYFNNQVIINDTQIGVKDDYLNLEEIEKIKIEECISRLGNRKLVAKELGIGVATLYRKIKKYRLS